jgi:hypothetical protein
MGYVGKIHAKISVENSQERRLLMRPGIELIQNRFQWWAVLNSNESSCSIKPESFLTS